MVNAKKYGNETLKKNHTKSIAGIVILLLIITVIVYLYETYGSLPSAVIPTLLSGNKINASNLKSILLEKVAASNYFIANYSGNITINTDPDMQVTIEKYMNIYLYQIDAFSVPNIGNLSITYTEPVNGTAQNLSSVCVYSDNPIIASRFGTVQRVSICKNPSEYPVFSEKVANLLMNISSLENINITTYSVSSYLGQPCYFFSGSGNIKINSSIIGSTSGPTTPADVNFSSCLSMQYNLPLYFNANINSSNGATIKMYLHNIRIGPSSKTTIGQIGLP